MADPHVDSTAGTDPRLGMVLVFEGREWGIAGRSSYRNPDDWQITEWECRAASGTGYLLKEIDPAGRVTWFFTREIPTADVRLPDGTALAKHPTRPDREPPPILTYGGGNYRHADVTAGTHEDDSGTSQRKTTWDYWDDRRQFNLAVELWTDGSVECYRGEYVAPGQFVLRAASPGLSGVLRRPVAVQGRPGRAALFALPVGYLIALFTNRPVDACLTAALAAALAVAWLVTLWRARRAALGALACGVVAGLIFWSYPPLSTWPGALALAATPAAVAWIGRGGLTGDARPAVRMAVGLATVAPLVAVGLHIYFRYAPGPHAPGQFLLALGPALVGGAFALVASLLLIRTEEK